MTLTRLVRLSLRYHWRMHASVCCGVVVATAVLSGALLVGDSMRGSLRDLTLDRLGRIDDVLLAPRFFREELVDETADGAEFKRHFTLAVPANYHLEKILGENIRGWEDRDDENPDSETRNGAPRRLVDVTLLKAAAKQEQLTLHLPREGPVGQSLRPPP